MTRCLGLAAALAEIGGACVFCVVEDPDAENRVAAGGHEFVSLPPVPLGSSEDIAGTIQTIEECACDAAIVDSYHFGIDWLEAVARRTPTACLVDDDARPAPCALIINGGAGADSDHGDRRLLFGPQYNLLPPELWDIEPRAIAEPMREVLVTVGGGDRAGLLPRIVRGLDGVAGDFAVTAVAGPFTDAAGVKEAADAAHHRTRVLGPVPSLTPLLLASDLAVTAAGHTLHESARAGVPAIGVQVAENQARNLAALARAGAALPVTDGTLDEKVAAVVRHVSSLLTNSELRTRMADAGRHLIDGQGARRAAAAVLDLAKRA